MKLILAALFMIACTLQSAEMERITMEDGQVLIGLYNEATGTVSVNTGKITASIVVDRRRIAKREILSEQEKTALIITKHEPEKKPQDKADLAGILSERKGRRDHGADLLRLTEEWTKRNKEFQDFSLTEGRMLEDTPEAKDNNKKFRSLKAASDAAEKEYKDAIQKLLNAALPGVTAAIVRRQQEEAKIKEMEDASVKAATDLILPGLMKLEPVKVTESSDPTLSELARNRRAYAYNSLIANLREQGRSEPHWRRIWSLVTSTETTSLIAEFGQP